MTRLFRPQVVRTLFVLASAAALAAPGAAGLADEPGRGEGFAALVEASFDPDRKKAARALADLEQRVASRDLDEARAAAAALRSRAAYAEAALKRLGAHVFRGPGRKGPIVEVVWNRGRHASDGHLRFLSAFPRLTDLSLEETAVGDAGMAEVARLRHLEWLNLYRSRVGDAGLAHLATLPRLSHLPVGETRVTDTGLAHLAGGHRQLRYLGLRGNAVTDAGLAHLAALTGLRGLHLGQTKVTDAGLAHLAALPKLQRLWLHDTAVTDAGLTHLSRLSGLRELFLWNTAVSPAGVAKIESALPRCRVVVRVPSEGAR